MKQQDFEKQNSDIWIRFNEIIEQPQTAAAKQKGKIPSEFPILYRQLCSHLAIAKQRHYSQTLVARLNRLVTLGHHLLYQRESKLSLSALLSAVSVFPKVLAENRSFVIAATLLFVLPGLVMGLACYLNDALVFSLMSPEQVREFESMYVPSNERFGEERGSASDLQMFGFYIYNNIGIAFRTFAGGVLFGLGAVFFLFYNGLHIGAVAGRLTEVGFSITFYPFVIGHGAFELTAIVFAGAAGLKIGFSLISPGQYTRLHALKMAARSAVVILYGATFMLFVAAFLEAFWSSSSTLPVALKLSVGALLWVLVIWFCFFFRVGKKQHRSTLTD